MLFYLITYHYDIMKLSNEMENIKIEQHSTVGGQVWKNKCLIIEVCVISNLSWTGFPIIVEDMFCLLYFQGRAIQVCMFILRVFLNKC